jgi:hypothetical protein
MFSDDKLEAYRENSLYRRQIDTHPRGSSSALFRAAEQLPRSE